MSKKELFESVKANPARFYRSVADVRRDRRWDDEQRIAILTAWKEREPTRTREIDGQLAEFGQNITTTI